MEISVSKSNFSIQLMNYLNVLKTVPNKAVISVLILFEKNARYFNIRTYCIVTYITICRYCGVANISLRNHKEIYPFFSQIFLL